MKARKLKVKKTTALLTLIGSGFLLGIFMRRKKRRQLPAVSQKAKPDPVDEASRDSFPASDAPSWTSG